MVNRKKIIPFCIIIMGWSVFLAVTVLHLGAVEVKKIEINRYEDFREGQFKGTALDSKGRLFIGPQVKEITGPGKEYYLSLDTAPNGDIYVGTGHQAAVYRVKPTAVPPAGANTATPAEGPAESPGNVEAIFETDEELDVFAVLVSSAGSGSETIYAATSPEGKIYKITKDKGKKDFFDTDEKFIWDLKEDKTGNIICAVGNSGGVYLVTPAGEGVKIFSSEDAHLISLYITRSNSILVGSGDRGILYRIDNRKVKVLYDSPFAEVRGICEDNEGNIYFSAAKEISMAGQMRPKSPDENPKASFAKSQAQEKEVERTVEKSVLYCLNTGGIVEKIWASATEYIYCAYYDEKNNRVIIGTGDSGRVYSVKKDGTFALIYESDSAQIFKIAGNRGGGFTLITDNTASLKEIENTPNSKGIFYSDVYDLQIQSTLGRLYWEAETTPQTEVSLSIRTGNSNVPDNTWSQWSAPFTDGQNSNLNISDCRYFQAKALLNSKNAAENVFLERIKIFYIQSNLGPQLKKLEVKKNTPKPPAIVETGGDKVPTPSSKGKVSNSLTAAWEARDLNKDKLKYTVYLKRTDSRNWILVKEDITETQLELDAQLYQDGKYVLRVTADDTLSNPPSLAKSNELVSSPFIIDSTAPVAANFSVTGNRLVFTVEDKTSLISNVWYSFDGKLWYPVFPVDMLNDSMLENFDFSINNLQSKKIIFLKVMDEFDNCKVFQEEW